MQHQLHSDQLSVTINSFGAEVCSVKNKHGLEFIWQADKHVWARHAPVLFPIVGKLNNNMFTYQGKNFELPQHGFARDIEFEFVSGNEANVSYALASSQRTNQKFPFDFHFEISYQLKGSVLTITYTITNSSASHQLLFSVGAHPGFNCPLEPGEKFEDYYLQFENQQLSQTQLEDGLRTDRKTKLELTDNKLYLSEGLFDNDALVFENLQVDSIHLCSSRSSHKIMLQCKDWPYFGVWTKKGTKQFICLEPWYGIADRRFASGDLDRKDGIIRLEPGKQFKASFSITFS